MSKNAKHNLDKLLRNCESVYELASEEATQVIGRLKTLGGRRLDQVAKQFEKARIDSMIALETMLLTNRKFAREVLES